MVNIKYTYILFNTQTLGYQEVFFGREINDNHDYRHIPKTNAQLCKVKQFWEECIECGEDERNEEEGGKGNAF